MTVLHLAVSSGDVQTVDALLRAGVSRSATDWMGRTALHTAVLGRHTAIAKLLLGHTTSTNTTTTTTTSTTTITGGGDTAAWAGAARDKLGRSATDYAAGDVELECVLGGGGDCPLSCTAERCSTPVPTVSKVRQLRRHLTPFGMHSSSTYVRHAALHAPWDVLYLVPIATTHSNHP